MQKNKHLYFSNNLHFAFLFMNHAHYLFSLNIKCLKKNKDLIKILKINRIKHSNFF